MKRNGFTLIELLAVIVILAIIALIATPIILGIINDAREKANERSVELYASAIKNAIMVYQLKELKTVQAGSYTNETLPFDVEYDGDVECSTIELYENGGIYVTGCTVNGIEVDYIYGTKQVEKGKMSAVCNPITVSTEGVYTAGDKYECDVDPKKEGYDYIFFVLSSTTTSVNLIMDSNITLTGEAIKDANPTDTGLIPWYADARDNSYGPITAMNYLQTATANWKNVNLQTINTFETCEFDSNYNVICTDKNMTEYKVNARLPYHSEIGVVSTSTAYLYNYMENGTGNTNSVSGVWGYWTLSAIDSDSSWGGGYLGGTGSSYVDAVDYYGIRPVINLSI